MKTKRVKRRPLNEEQASFYQKLGEIMCRERERKSIRMGISSHVRVLQKAEHQPLVS